MVNSCNGCGLCCKLFLINLSQKEYSSKKYRTMFEEHGLIEDFKLAKESGANLLAKKAGGGCIYLDGSQCGIHANRPKVCADFFCTSRAKKLTGMVEIIKIADKQKISSVLQIKG